jgi:hypothetical protein
MSEEMLLESAPWESDESEDSAESEDAFIESEDSEDDFGEARPVRRVRRRVSRYVPVKRGVSGVRFRGPDGQLRNLPFPSKLATAAETNRGLASQEAGRRALAQRLEKLESGIRVNQKKDAAITGTVYLGIGGGLTAYSLFKANERENGVSFREAWISQTTTTMATMASATQLATSAAKWLIHGQYHRSGIGIAADVVSVAQIAGYAFATLSKDQPPRKFHVADKLADVLAMAPNVKEGDLVWQRDKQIMLQWRRATNGAMEAITA